MFRKFLYGNYRYFFISILLVVITLLLELITPYLLNRTEKNWDDILTDKVEEIKFYVIEQIREKENRIDGIENDLRNKFEDVNVADDSSEILFQILSGNNYRDINLEIFNDDFKLIAWNNDSLFSKDDFGNNGFAPGEDFFHTNKLITYLSRIDALKLDGKIYLLSISLPFDKHFRIQDKYFNEKSFVAGLEEKFKTSFKINYSPVANFSLDGRDHSFEILNNFNNKIGLVTFEKPLKINTVTEVENYKTKVQILFILLAFLLLGAGLIKYFVQLESRFIQFLILLVYVICLRIIFFLLKFPSFFFGGDLNNPAYFSSRFVFGIVRSPLEFLITTILLLIVVIYLYKFTVSYFFSEKGKSGWLRFILALFFYVFLFLITLRELESSIRSVIFDSTLLYFKEQDLFPVLPAVLMQLNILILSVGILTFTSILIILIMKRIPVRFRTFLVFFLIFVFFQVAGMVYDINQASPQGTHLIRFIYISLAFLVAYLIIFVKQIRYWTFVYITVSASFISIILLNYYNSILEKNSVKMITSELAQPRENWLDFLVNETLNFAKDPESIYPVASVDDLNYNSLAFSIWSRSSLKRESLISDITLLDSARNILGQFSFDMHKIDYSSEAFNFDSTRVYEDTMATGEIYLTGTTKLHLKSKEVFLVVSVLEDQQGLPINEEPEFLVNRRLLESAAVREDNLLIFEIQNDQVKSILGDVNITPAQVRYIKNTVANENTNWINIKNNDVIYSAYVNVDKDNFVIAAQKEKAISSSLYDFFKVFFIHSLFIIALILILLTYDFSKTRSLKLTFRTQLLVALLFISIIPLILLAFYFRNLTEEKNESAIYYKLQKRALSLEQYVDKYNPDQDTIFDSILAVASEDLGIDFAIYEGNKYSYSTKSDYYKSGLLSEILIPKVYESFILEGGGEILVQESIENYKFNSFYYRSGFGNGNLIFKVSDSFNSILLPMSATELDTFLFGSYFLAVILIVIMSAILSNQIASPIRNLTKATKSVAGGDLNISVAEQRRGEVKDLIAGFNMMVKELKKMQSDMAEVERETAWKEMAKQVAHEIKNPLTPMKLAVQQLVISYKDKSPKFDEIFNKVTGTVISQIDTLKNIASEFSNFARMPNLKLESVNVIKVINEAANLFLDEKVSIQIEKENDNVIINGDEDQFKRMIINLIRNSIQANASRIILRIDGDENIFRLRIIDNGTGMPNEIISKIFQNEFTTKVHGMGLGLTMAKRYIESLNGSIEIEETSETGTTILIKLLKK